MKNLILILFIALVSCSGSDDNNTASVNIDENLAGKWSLINYGKWPQGNFGYEKNDIIWEFHQDGTLIVTINESVELHSELPLPISGNYECSTFQTPQAYDFGYYDNLAISGFPDTLGYRFHEFQTNYDLSLGHEDPTDGNSYWMNFKKIE